MLRRTLLSSLVSLGGCAAAPPPLAAPEAPPPLHLAPLADLFAAGGLDWLVAVQPPALRAAPHVAAALTTLLPATSTERLARHLGFDPTLSDEIVAAGYGDAQLFALRVAHDPVSVEKHFVDRLTSDRERATEGPSVVRVSGVIGSRPRAFADLEQSVLLFEAGPRGPLRAAVAFAQRKLRRARPALAVEPLASLARRLGPAPALALAPARVAEIAPGSSPMRGAHGLVERAAAVGLAVTPSPDPAGLRLRLVVLGAWDDPPAEATRRLERTLDDVARSPLGKLTSLGAPLTPWSIGGDREAIHAEGVVDARKLADGLHAATSASLAEVFPQGNR